MFLLEESIALKRRSSFIRIGLRKWLNPNWVIIIAFITFFSFSALCTLEDIFGIFIPDDVKVVR